MVATIKSALKLPSGVELPNRLVKAAMTERLADVRNGVTDRLINLYRAWADGEIGLQITGNVQVDRRNLEAAGNVVIDAVPSNLQLDLLSRWADACHGRGGKVFMQLSHAGRQTPKMVNQTPDAPSAVAVNLPGGQFGQPKALTEDGIRRLIDQFGVATRVARQAGFDGVQIHGAHGYLISQFLTPLVNQRTDRWGGSIEGRARFLIDVIKSAKAEAGPGFGVALKLNSADFQKGGFGPQDSVAVIGMLNGLDLDFLEISGGSYEQPKMVGLNGLEPAHVETLRPSTRIREAYFLDYAAEVRSVAKMPLMVTGGMRSAAAMNEALTADETDLIGLGRPLCVDADAPAKLLSGQTDRLDKWEDSLRIGPGWLGPNSPIGVIKALNGFAMQSWYYSQIHAIADNQPVNRRLGLLSAFMKMNGLDLRMAKAYLKALE